MEQGDGYCDDTCPCDTCRPLDVGLQLLGIVATPHVTDSDKIRRQQAAIDDLVAIAGYLPEAYAILAKHGLR